MATTKICKKKQNQQKKRQEKNNYNNVTQRHKRTKQTNQSPTENNNENFPQLQKQQNQDTDEIESTTREPEETTIIPETDPLPETQNDEPLQSPSMVTTTRTEETTPKPNDIIAPEITTDKQKTTPKSQKQLKDVVKTYKAKKFTTQLQQKDFCDTGTFTKVNQEEKEEILARAMYDRIGLYDPSNEYVNNYKHKNVLQIYQRISENRPTKNNNLLRIYNIMSTIELRG